LAVALTLEQIDQRLAVLAETISMLRAEIRSAMPPKLDQQPQPLHAQARAGAGHFNPIASLRLELKRCGYGPNKGWDVVVDLVDQGIFQAALSEYAGTVGKRDARRSVEGFRAYILDGLEQEAA
jgi:hypothetical protein